MSRKIPDTQARICVCLSKDTVDTAKRICHMRQTNMNAMLKRLVEKYVEDNMEQLKEFDKLSQKLD